MFQSHGITPKLIKVLVKRKIAQRNNNIPATLLIMIITFADNNFLILLAKKDFNKSVVNIMETIPTIKNMDL